MKKIALISTLLLVGCDPVGDLKIKAVSFGYGCAQLHLTEEECIEWAETSVMPSDQVLEDAFMKDFEHRVEDCNLIGENWGER